jgi:hypothetical protein
MTKKTAESKTKRRTKVKNMPKSEIALIPAQAKKVKGGQGYTNPKAFQIISPGRDN